MASAAGEIFDEHGGDAMAIAELLEIELRSNERLIGRYLELEAQTSAELTQLRARDEAAKAVVQWWTENRHRQAAVEYAARVQLDALARAHDPQEQAMQELVAQSEELGLYDATAEPIHTRAERAGQPIEDGRQDQ